jgi:hypothetical protein
MKLIIRYYENMKASIILLAFVVAKNLSIKYIACQFCMALKAVFCFVRKT